MSASPIPNLIKKSTALFDFQIQTRFENKLFLFGIHSKSHEGYSVNACKPARYKVEGQYAEGGTAALRQFASSAQTDRTIMR